MAISLTYLLAFLVACVGSAALTPLIRDLANAWGWVDEPDADRKIHQVAVPRIGGVGLALSFMLPVLSTLGLHNPVSLAYLRDPWRVVALLAGACVMVGLGLLDDLRGVRPVTKLLIQVAVASAAYGLGVQIHLLANPFGEVLSLGLLSYPVTVLWIVGIVNGINLIDGLDGLAGGVSLFAVLILFALAVMHGNEIVGLSSIALAGALIGFLRYNFNPASIFMGDSGSLFLGYVLAITAISGSAKSSTVVSLTIPILVMGLPILDTSMTVLRRLLSGRHLFEADREHIHHRLLDWGLSHRQVVLVLYLLCGMLCGTALVLVFASSAVTATVLVAFGGASVVLTYVLGYLRWQRGQLGAHPHQSLLTQLDHLQRTAKELEKTANSDELFTQLAEFAKELQVDTLELEAVVTGSRGVRRFGMRWPEEASPPSGVVFAVQRLEQRLNLQRETLEITGHLAVTWRGTSEDRPVPEAPGYQLIALIVRDRLLTFAERAFAAPVVPFVIPSRQEGET